MKKSLLLLFALLVSATLFAQENTLTTPDSISARGVNHDAIEITWKRVEGATDYNIYKDNTLLGSVKGTSCIIEDLEPETEYCFNISAVNETEESAQSKEACATTFYVCDAVQNVEAKVEMNDPNYGKKYKITCTWDIVEGAEAYAVYVATQFYPDGMYMGTVSTNNFIMGSDVEGELYFFVKTICDSELKIVSEYSEQVGVILNEDIEDVSAVKAPENLTATAKSTSSIELTWDAAENAMSYFVYRNEVEIANITGTTYVDENLAYNTEYCYTITSMGANSESDPSEEACAITLGESLAENTSSFNIFPNPATDNLSIEANEEIKEVNIYNIIGVSVYNEQCTNNNLNVNISEFNSGVYFIKVKTGNGETVKRFIKQ